MWKIAEEAKHRLRDLKSIGEGRARRQVLALAAGLAATYFRR